MSTELTKPRKTVKDLLASDSMKARFAEVLKDRAPQFLAAVTSQAASALSDCKPESVISAAFISATLNLAVNRELGFAWLVPYSQKGEKLAQFQIGYKGFIQLAQRSGLYQRLNACVIRDGAFKGFDGFGEPVIDFQNNDDATKKIVGYYCGFQLTNGFTKHNYWSAEQCREHGKRFSKTFANGPWRTDFDAMALKTVIKATLTKWGPLSVELQSAATFDQASVDDSGNAIYVDRAGPQGDELTDSILSMAGSQVAAIEHVTAPTTADIKAAKTQAELEELNGRVNQAAEAGSINATVADALIAEILERSNQIGGA